MSKLRVVFGATGQQGGSVVDSVIHDAELSNEYRVRGVTRATLPSPRPRPYSKKGVEVVPGDLEDGVCRSRGRCVARTHGVRHDQHGVRAHGDEAGGGWSQEKAVGGRRPSPRARAVPDLELR